MITNHFRSSPTLVIGSWWTAFSPSFHFFQSIPPAEVKRYWSSAFHDFSNDKKLEELFSLLKRRELNRCFPQLTEEGSLPQLESRPTEGLYDVRCLSSSVTVRLRNTGVFQASLLSQFCKKHNRHWICIVLLDVTLVKRFFLTSHNCKYFVSNSWQ